MAVQDWHILTLQRDVMKKLNLKCNIEQLAIIIGMIVLMLVAIIIDGAFGERVFGALMTSFGLVLGYHLRKNTEKVIK